MKEQDIIDAGFERVDVTTGESGCEHDWYYYTYDFCKGFSLISLDNEEANYQEKWYVEFFDSPELRITNRKHLFTVLDLIKTLKQNEGKVN